MRLAKFFFGFLYGAVVNTITLGFTFAAVFAGYTASAMGGGGTTFLAAGEWIGIFLAIVLGGAACLGFIFGACYGLTLGAWYSAMDFYNHGIKRGLSSPFRFVPAIWNKVIKDNPEKLNAYAASTDIHYVKKQKQARKKIASAAMTHADACEKMISQEKSKETSDLPVEICQLIAEYAIDTEKLITNEVEEKTRGEKIDDPNNAPGEKFDKYFTPQEAVKIAEDTFKAQNKERVKKAKEDRRLAEKAKKKKGGLGLFSFFKSGSSQKTHGTSSHPHPTLSRSQN